MNTFFTADTHFGHENIIKYCNRPFANAAEMDEALIERWNRVVARGDVIYHLGDFSMGKPDAYLSRLNGSKHFIWGNHDRKETKNSPVWASSGPYKEIRIDGQDICLFHYGMRVWNRGHHGSLSFYGHSHGDLPAVPNSLDVGVDSWDFTPIDLPQIRTRLNLLFPDPVKIKHHD